MSESQPAEAPSWWDQPRVTPKQAATVMVVWLVLDMIKITLEHLL